MDLLTVSIVTPGRQVTVAEVREVRAPSALGQVGILPGHTPLLADLMPGTVELVGPDHSEGLAVSGGFLEVDRDHVIVLAETAERAMEIDVERARRALGQAEALLKKLGPADAGYDEAALRAERAQARLAVAAH